MEFPAEFHAVHGGVVSTRALERVGFTRKQLSRMARREAITRLRPGWYALPDADDTVVAAVRAGGALGCLSALRWRGVWIPTHHAPHVRRSGHGCRVTSLPGCTVPGGPLPVVRSIDNLGLALQAAAGCVETDELVAVVDSALHKKLLTMSDAVELFSGHPEEVRRAITMCDARAESGTESLVRVRLRRMGLRVRPQAEIRGIGRVDLLVGDRWILECDSREHHSSAAAYENDRSRDLSTLGLDMFSGRLTYHAVQHRWDEIEAVVRAVVRRRRHLRRHRSQQPKRES